DTTTVSAPVTCAASCPTHVGTPAAVSAASVADAVASEPWTRTPRACRSRATTDMPAPPTPIRCTVPQRAARSVRSSPTSSLLDQVGDGRGSVGPAHARGRESHGIPALVVREQRQERALDPRPRQQVVLD